MTASTLQPFNPSTPLPIAIIGAGITGLTAAFRLQQKGLPVTVYEASDRVGGVIRSLRLNGYLAEFGPNSILETSPKIVSLVRDLGLEGRRIYSDPNAENRYLVRYRRPIAMPASPFKFFGTPLFSWRAKLALLREPFIPRKISAHEESVAEFVVRRLGKEFLDYAINPLVAGIYAGDPARLSVKHGFPKLLALEEKYGSLIKGQIFGAKDRKKRGEVSKQEAKKLSFDEGLQVLPDTLGAALGNALQLRATVTLIEQTASGCALTVCRDGHEQRHDHAAVLFAVPTYQLPEIRFAAGQELNTALLKKIHYPPVASVVLGFRRADVAHPLDGFGMLIPAAEGFRILGTLFSSSLFPNRAPADHVTLTSYVGGVRAPDLALQRPPELVRMTVEDLRVLLGVTGEPTFQHVVLYPNAIPQYEVGYGRFKDLMSAIETKAPGLFFAGHYRDGISLGDSIVSGHDVAERMAARFNASIP
ncbi:MAG: protoporphyrinogen oxidase [Verrucomicrobia bacterium]|nr:protoporphyrinogen oxidase [Verrucomicrobiota bacterium]